MYIVNYYKSAQKFGTIVSVLLFQLNCLQKNRNYAVGTDANLFRFHNFEPRVFHIHYSNDTFKPKAATYSYDKLMKLKNQTPESHTHREQRGFHIHSSDKDTTVEVEFVIPIMRVPIEGGMQLTKSTVRNLLNLKSGSLLWAGVFIAVGTLVAGAWNTITAIRPALFPYKRHVRRQNEFDNFDEYIGSATTLEDDIGTVINERLMENNIDLNACMQKTICQYVKKATEDVRSGKASGIQKILDGLANVNIWHQYFDDTTVYMAMEAGRNSKCNKWEQRCKWPKFWKF